MRLVLGYPRTALRAAPSRMRARTKGVSDNDQCQGKSVWPELRARIDRLSRLQLKSIQPKPEVQSMCVLSKPAT